MSRHLEVLLFFVKYPEPGKVKTRLGKTIGFSEAAEIYKNLVEKTLSVIAPEPGDSYQIFLYFDPPEKESLIQEWLGSCSQTLAQVSGDLTDRLKFGFQKVFDQGASEVLAIGSDTVGLSREGIRTAFETLKKTDVVLGPSEDGGYYLIG